MNPTVILGISSLMIETTLVAVKLMKKQKLKIEMRFTYKRHISRSWSRCQMTYSAREVS